MYLNKEIFFNGMTSAEEDMTSGLDLMSESFLSVIELLMIVTMCKMLYSEYYFKNIFQLNWNRKLLNYVDSQIFTNFKIW